jgi:LPXTG-site transpeptidase (sortase) family protein
LLIPSLSLNLPVAESEIINGVWQVTSQGVSHLAQSVFPGQPGNSIFYGHNWLRLLGRLHNIRLQDEIIILAGDGRSLTFQVVEITKVDPSDVSILENSTDSTLILYTCTGFMDTKRLVIIGKPLSQGISREQ